ncbi:hypothetical protein J4438_01355 [Candidatus Woesearchaeota archaeon]|nr:hypothetical protein [Candidatus Woesearchaeota archaeon]
MVEKNPKSAFWKSLVLTMILFLIGISLGMLFESIRTNYVKDKYEELEFQLLDSQLRTNFYQKLDNDFCDYAIQENLDFSDRIYQEGRKLEVYEKFNKLGDNLEKEKKKYALLKVEFWMNSRTLKEQCNAEYTNIIYFYRNEPLTDEEKQEQNVQSRILLDLKEKYGVDIMLIPIPLDFNIGVINVYTKSFDITNSPSILIDDSIKLEGIHSLEEIEKLI